MNPKGCPTEKRESCDGGENRDFPAGFADTGEFGVLGKDGLDETSGQAVQGVSDGNCGDDEKEGPDLKEGGNAGWVVAESEEDGEAGAGLFKLAFEG